MKSWGRSALIFVAYSLALLHTAIPHHHSATPAGRMSVAPIHSVAPSVSSLLALVFSTDLGKGHLETFQKSNHAQNVHQFAVALLMLGFLFALQNAAGTRASARKTVSHFAEKFYRQRILFSAAGFRAPPAFVRLIA